MIVLHVIAAAVFAQGDWIGVAPKDGPGCALLEAVVLISPAAIGGLKRGDCIGSVNGVRVRTGNELVLEVEKCPRQHKLEVTLTDGRRVAITRAARPPDFALQVCNALRQQRLAIRYSTNLEIEMPSGTVELPPGSAISIEQFLKSLGASPNQGEDVTVIEAPRCGADAGQKITKAASLGQELSVDSYVQVKRAGTRSAVQLPDGRSLPRGP